MGIPVMSRFQNPFVYGRFEKVGNFSYISIRHICHITHRRHPQVCHLRPGNNIFTHRK